MFRIINRKQIVLALGLLLAVKNFAFSQIWDGGGVDDNWTTAQNWVGDIVPGNPTTATISLGGVIRLTPVVDVAWEMGGLSFLSSAGAFTLSGQNLTIGSGGITVNSTNNQTITNSTNLSVSQIWTALGGNLSHSGAVGLGSNFLTINTSTGRVVNLGGSVSGSGGIIKTGTGRLLITGSNSFGGSSDLLQGTVEAANDQAFGSGVINFLGATLQAQGNRTFSNHAIVHANTTFTGNNLTFAGNFVLNSNSTVTVNNPLLRLEGGIAEIGGPMRLTKGGTGAMVVNATYGATGEIQINAGTLGLAGAAVLPSSHLRLGGGVLSMNGNFNRDLGTGAGQVSWIGNGGFAAFGGNLSVQVPGTPVWGSTANFLSASQQLILSSSIANGVVTWESPFSLGSPGNRSITVNDNPASANDWARIAGNITGNGNLVKLGNGRLDLTGENDFTGFVQVGSGVLVFQSIAPVGQPSALGSGSQILLGQTTAQATLTYTGNGHSSDRPLILQGSTGSRVLSASGTGALVLSGNVAADVAGAKVFLLNGNSTANNTLSGVISNGNGVISVTKSGTSTWVLSGNNTYSGNTTLSAGVLGAGSNGSFGSGNLLLAGGTVATVGGARTVNNNVLITANSQVGAGSNLTFSGNVTNNGANRILTINAGADVNFTHQLRLSESTTNRTFTITGPGNAVVSGIITNGLSSASRLSKTGLGRLILSGANTYGGNTTISGGTLEVQSSGALGSAAAPTVVASGATLATNGTFSLAERLVITGNGVGGGGALRHLAGAVTVTENVTLTGTTLISSDSGTLTLSPPTGDSISGSFALTIGGSGDIVLVRRYQIGTASLLKNGSGRLLLESTATSAASGNVTVAAGTYEVNGSLAAGFNLLIQGSGRLAGTGSSGRPVAVSGEHAPGQNFGDGVGIQTMNQGLSYQSGAIYRWQLDANSVVGPGTNFDQVVVAGGNLTINSGAGMALVFNATGSIVNWNDNFWDVNRSWTAISFTSSGVSSGNFGSFSLTTDSLGQSLASVRPGATFSLDKVGNDVFVKYVVPEPSVSTLGLLCLMGCFAAAGRRFVRKNNIH